MHCTECNRQLPPKSVIPYSAVYMCNHQFSVCESCHSILQALPPTQCPECKQSLQANATNTCCVACDTPEASSQLITTNDRCNSFPDLHPLAEIGYSPGKDELVCHKQLTTSMHVHHLQTVDNSLDGLVQAMDEQAAELEFQRYGTTSLLQPVIKQFYSPQPSDFLSHPLIWC